MTRPLHIWIVFGAALTVLLLATAWVSVAVWRLDEAQFQNQLLADHEEKVRLALWRMDSFMSPLIVEEAARPSFHYRAFHTPEKAYSKAMTSVNEIMVPSPLLHYSSSNTVLHFQMDAQGHLTSPQVPVGQERAVAMAGNVDPDRFSEAKAHLQELQTLLGGRVDAERAVTIMGNSPGNPLKNRDILLLACAPFRTNVVPLFDQEVSPGVEPWSDPQQLASPPTQQREQQQQEPEQQALAQLKPSNIANWGAQKQRVLNTGEQAARANVYQEIMQKDNASTLLLAEGVWGIRGGPIRPLWVGSELLLVRRAISTGGSYIQGVWLNWNHLKTALSASIADLFPSADLRPMTAPMGEIDSRMMASIPIKLVTTPALAGSRPFWTPIRATLGMAWICVVLAGVAVAVLLHGVVSLSERRGDFVSAVTHELRTPLTTFKMYSEMLADGMVPEESRRQDYLRTLCSESNRLSHLVENVLAYARLERGNARHRTEKITVRALINPMQNHFKQRAEQAGMSMAIDLPDEISTLEVETDASVVEQILFNLVDNACKYANTTTSDKCIHLEARRWIGDVVLRVRDSGEGLNGDALKRLFKPFCKSAEAAAQSAPGVGLGLALCRRLSRGIGAELSYEGTSGGGACFVLKLPAA